MKAAVVCANEDVQYLDYEEPIPGPGEVKVKVRASGICGFGYSESASQWSTLLSDRTWT